MTLKVRDQDVAFWIRKLPEYINSNLSVAQLGRLTSIDNNRKTASVQPMALKSDGSKRSLLLNVHVGRLLRDELSVGDVVLVLFLDRALSNWDGSNSDFELSGTRMHDINDAFIVEVY